MISAVVLTKNNEKNIVKTLQSLHWCTELIVVDDRSTDNTVKLAKGHGAHVFLRTLGGNFAEQRNFGLSKAHCEWVLFVDSDEVVTRDLAREIRQTVKETQTDGLYLKRTDFLFGKELRYGETSRVRLLRLGRRGKGVWERAVHEVWTIRGNTRELSHPLLHYPHQTIAEFLADINTYSTYNANVFYAQRVRVPAWHIIAYPAGKFFVNYVLFQGFRDGTAGIVVALMMSFHSFLTRAKLWLLWDKKR